MADEITAYKSMDGGLHESRAQAVAADIHHVLNSSHPGRGQLINNAAVWAMIDKRDFVIQALTSLDPEN